jgi:hypothetical protein
MYRGRARSIRLLAPATGRMTAAFCEQVNSGAHRVTRRDAGRGAGRLHPSRATHCLAGVTRMADDLSLVTFEAGQYSVPRRLTGQPMHVCRHGEQVVITYAGVAGPAEVARHEVTAPSTPSGKPSQCKPGIASVVRICAGQSARNSAMITQQVLHKPTCTARTRVKAAATTSTTRLEMCCIIPPKRSFRNVAQQPGDPQRTRNSGVARRLDAG